MLGCVQKTFSGFWGRGSFSARVRVFGLVVLSFLAPAREALAQCIPSPGACFTNDATDQWWSSSPDFSGWMKDYLLRDFYEERVVKDLWEKKFHPTLQSMTAQIVANQASQTATLGTFIDGTVANQATLTLQGLQADAYKNYTPSEGLCRFGTQTRSLASSALKTEQNMVALASIAQARQLGTKGGSADIGMIMDRATRIDQFTRVYCDPADNNGGLGPICGGSSPQTEPSRFNKDISIDRTLLSRQTLNVDLTDGQKTNDEEDILALANNLYGHDVLKRLTETSVSNAAGNAAGKANYLDLRQLVALRNVAESSYNAAAARRAQGTGAVGPFMAAALQEMGMSAQEAARFLDSGTGNPSYNAQMDMLTKRIYQNPNFYTHLIDKPANIDRQIAAMQAIGLMQDRDIYTSLRQQELLISLVLEMKLRREQQAVENALGVRGGAAQ